MFSKHLRLKNVPAYFVGVYLIITPFLLLPGLGLFDSKRVLQILLLSSLSILSLVSSFNNYGTDKRILLSKGILLWGIMLFGLGVLSSFVSEFVRFAFIEIVMLAIIFSCCIFFSKQTIKGHYRLGKVIYTVAVLFSLIYLIYFFGNYIAAYLNPLVPQWPNRLDFSLNLGDTIYTGKEVLHFGNRRFFNHIQTWTLPLLVALSLYFKPQRIYRNLILILIICWWGLVFASRARGTTVSFIIACIILFVLFRKRSYRFLGTAAGTAMGGYIIYYLMFKAFVIKDSLPVIKIGDSARFEMWGKAWELWLANPLLGVGPMHYAATGETTYSAHPHNFYLQLLAEWGIVALLCLVALLLLYLIFIKKEFLKSNFEFIELSPRSTAIYMGIMGSAVAGFAHAGVSGIFHTPMSQIWAIIIIAWLISLWNRKADSAKTISIQRKYFSIGFVLLITGLMYLISPDINRLDRDHVRFREKFEDASISPRFWEQGLIYEDADSTSNDLE